MSKFKPGDIVRSKRHAYIGIVDDWARWRGTEYQKCETGDTICYAAQWDRGWRDYGGDFHWDPEDSMELVPQDEAERIFADYCAWRLTHV